MKILWTVDHPEVAYSSLTGFDDAGNKYYQTANREVVGVELTDGRRAQGWTPEEALRAALTSEAVA